MIEELLKETETKIIHGRIEMFYKDGFFHVIDSGLKVQTKTISVGFESALQTFWYSVNK